jgi:glycosyltransferase involved in cell wall biosynthesis
VIEIDDYPFHEREIVRPSLIWMRSFHEVYNPEMAIRVLAGLKKIWPDASLTMAGADKGLRTDTEKLAIDLGLSSSIRFVGFLDHHGKLEEFSKADIYINTNRIDNMPVSVLEARALGLPVVATEVGGLAYLITHGEDGLLVPDNDCEAMITAVKELVENPKLAHRLSLRGREAVDASDWPQVRAKWEAMLSDVLSDVFASGWNQPAVVRSSKSVE